MKIPLGGGTYLEPDESRDTRFHKRIVRVTPIVNTRSGHWCDRSGHWCDLECGHRIHTISRLIHAQGVVLCTQCRDLEAYIEGFN